jgi:hypothetical protein
MHSGHLSPSGRLRPAEIRPGCQRVNFVKPNCVCLCFAQADFNTGVETTHWNLTTMQTVFSLAMEKLCPEEQDKALALLPFSRK